jgi:hypothetical protein
MAMSASAMPPPAPIPAEVQSKPRAAVISTTVGASGVRAPVAGATGSAPPGVRRSEVGCARRR